jgi:hypothetical protein
MEQFWSLEDLLDANVALDVWDELERKSAEASRASK